MADPQAVEGQTALVTGAGKRLGRAIALALAAEGANVVVHYRSSEREADETAQLARQAGVQAAVVQADLGRPEEAESLLERAVEAAGTIQILINSASIFEQDRITDATLDSLARNIQINAIAPLQLARAVARGTEAGAIVNLLDAKMGDFDDTHAAYHVSKRMLFTLTRMMALEFAPGIRVNGVAPGLILPPVGQDESYLERLASTNPLNTYGCAADITDAVLFLLRSRFITGQVIYVDGGRHMRGSVYG
jgi:NAD(P)-dependent dehydrogenase (short-subunit alcohol dehydrogenase family)